MWTKPRYFFGQESSALDEPQGGLRPIESRKTSHHREIWRVLSESVLLKSSSPTSWPEADSIFLCGVDRPIPADRSPLLSVVAMPQCSFNVGIVRSASCEDLRRTGRFDTIRVCWKALAAPGTVIEPNSDSFGVSPRQHTENFLPRQSFGRTFERGRRGWSRP